MRRVHARATAAEPDHDGRRRLLSPSALGTAQVNGERSRIQFSCSCPPCGSRATIDPAGRYTVAISDFLLTGGEANLGFLTRANPEVSDVADLRDIRMVVIDELKRRAK